MSGYRTPAPRPTDTKDVVEFLRGAYIGPEVSRKAMALRVVLGILVMILGLRLCAPYFAVMGGGFALVSLPPFRRWWIRRRLRRAGLLEELAEYEASQRKR